MRSPSGGGRECSCRVSQLPRGKGGSRLRRRGEKSYVYTFFKPLLIKEKEEARLSRIPRGGGGEEASTAAGSEPSVSQTCSSPGKRKRGFFEGGGVCFLKGGGGGFLLGGGRGPWVCWGIKLLTSISEERKGSLLKLNKMFTRFFCHCVNGGEKKGEAVLPGKKREVLIGGNHRSTHSFMISREGGKKGEDFHSKGKGESLGVGIWMMGWPLKYPSGRGGKREGALATTLKEDEGEEGRL